MRKYWPTVVFTLIVMGYLLWVAYTTGKNEMRDRIYTRLGYGFVDIY